MDREAQLSMAMDYVMEFINAYGHPGILVYKDGLNSAIRSEFPGMSPKKVCDIMISKGLIKALSNERKELELFKPADFPQDMSDRAKAITQRLATKYGKG